MIIRNTFGLCEVHMASFEELYRSTHLRDVLYFSFVH